MSKELNSCFNLKIHILPASHANQIFIVLYTDGGEPKINMEYCVTKEEWTLWIMLFNRWIRENSYNYKRSCFEKSRGEK